MSFSDEITNFVKKSKNNADLVVRKTVLDIGTRLVNRTPVGDASYWKSKPPAGYTGGHARANWQHSTGSPKKKEIPGIDKIGGSTISKISNSTLTSEPGQDHYIANSVPYIERLEDGWSRQAPHGFLAITALEFQGIVDGITKGLKK